MRYILDRLREPGTMRSAIWVLLSVAGYATTDAEVAQYALMASAILGFISAALPEKSSKAADKVERAAVTAREASDLAVSAAQEAKAVTSQAAGIVDRVVRR